MNFDNIFTGMGILCCCYIYCLIVLCIMCKMYATTATTLVNNKINLPLIMSGGNIVNMIMIDNNTYFYIFTEISGTNSITFTNFDFTKVSIKMIFVGAGGGGSGIIDDNGIIKGFNGMGGGTNTLKIVNSKFVLNKLNITIGEGGKGNIRKAGEKGGDTIVTFIVNQPKINMNYADEIAKGGLGGPISGDNILVESISGEENFGDNIIRYSGNKNNDILGAGGKGTDTMASNGMKGCAIFKITYNVI